MPCNFVLEYYSPPSLSLPLPSSPTEKGWKREELHQRQERQTVLVLKVPCTLYLFSLEGREESSALRALRALSGSCPRGISNCYSLFSCSCQLARSSREHQLSEWTSQCWIWWIHAVPILLTAVTNKAKYISHIFQRTLCVCVFTGW